jgi:hypothetical protein
MREGEKCEKVRKVGRRKGVKCEKVRMWMTLFKASLSDGSQAWKGSLIKPGNGLLQSALANGERNQSILSESFSPAWLLIQLYLRG